MCVMMVMAVATATNATSAVVGSRRGDDEEEGSPADEQGKADEDQIAIEQRLGLRWTDKDVDAAAAGDG